MYRTRLVVSVLVAMMLFVASCGDDGSDTTDAGSLDDVPAFSPEPTIQSAPRPTSDLAALIQPAGSAATLPAAPGPRPVAMSYEAIGVSTAPVLAVGVEANGDMEIPGESEVGWYQYGPTPGAAGSAVLAAHISWNGRDGVFRRLPRARPGDRFTVTFEDGAIAEYQVVAIRQYAKNELPTEELFVTTGEPQVVLITCGGSFNRALNSYDDNIVAYAIPA